MAPALTRAFLAVPAGEQLSRDLTRRLDDWRGRLPLRWTRPGTWHLTLQFLGDWPADRLAALREALPDLADAAAFSLPAGGLGAFPDLKRPRVLFLHLADDGQAAALAARARGIVGRIWPRGPQDIRPFRPHLTLARVREPLTADEINLLRDIRLDELPALPVGAIHLVGSERLPGGSRHTRLAETGLRKKGE